jgi:hypothetical protein
MIHLQEEAEARVGDFGVEHTDLLFVIPVTQVRGLCKAS